MPDLSTSAITDRLTKALDRNTAALLTVAAEIAKASGRSKEAIQDWITSDVQENFTRALNGVQLIAPR
jgi:hypothetical protein